MPTVAPEGMPDLPLPGDGSPQQSLGDLQQWEIEPAITSSDVLDLTPSADIYPFPGENPPYPFPPPERPPEPEPTRPSEPDSGNGDQPKNMGSLTLRAMDYARWATGLTTESPSRERSNLGNALIWASTQEGGQQGGGSGNGSSEGTSGGGGSGNNGDTEGGKRGSKR